VGKRIGAGLLILAVICAAGVGVLLHHRHSWSASHPAYLRDLRAEGKDLRVVVQRNPQSALAAGYRACTWAQTHPQYPRDGSLRIRYVRMTNAPALGLDTHDGENDIPGFIAEAAWGKLCNVHIKEPSD
jgi:hypothetical protein